MAQNLSVSKQAPRPNILELIADGMSHLIARPWLAAIPVGLDAILALSPRLSGLSISQRLGSELAGSRLGSLNEFGIWLSERGTWGLERGVTVVMPSVVDGINRDEIYQPLSAGTVDLSLGSAVFLSISAMLLSALIFMIWETVLAVGAGLKQGRPTPIQVLRGWGSYVGVWLLAALVLGLVAALLLVPSALTSNSGISGTNLVGFLSLAGMLLLVVTMFTPEAIVLDGKGPISAIVASTRVVIENFWQSMAFFLLQVLLPVGLFSIWESIAHRPDGLIVAILLNAAMATSVAIASLGFYQARSRSDA